MDEHREQIIIAKLKSGDINALAHLVRAYQHRALRAAYLVTQDRALAEDVTQVAFVRVYENIAQFDASRRFLPWFLRIVVNLAVQSAQKQARTLSLDDSPHRDGVTFEDLLADPLPNPETELERQEMEASVQRMLEQLSPDQRAVIVLRYYVDLTEANMSEALAVPPGTIKSRLHAARRQLRSLMRLRPI
jgi:RNA polymerase sigma-70 factor, ECF subfamily